MTEVLLEKISIGSVSKLLIRVKKETLRVLLNKHVRSLLGFHNKKDIYSNYFRNWLAGRKKKNVLFWPTTAEEFVSKCWLLIIRKGLSIYLLVLERLIPIIVEY